MGKSSKKAFLPLKNYPIRIILKNIQKALVIGGYFFSDGVLTPRETIQLKRKIKNSNEKVLFRSRYRRFRRL